ncbi:MAG: hypothetical protein IJU54_03195, partial [Alphaproteobacteria bacterium]|nr:hypothetical protein [Alphaproteobacteria bacterium]
SYNETDNNEPAIKFNSKKPNNQLQLNNSELKLFNTANTPQVQRLSLGLSASYYSNPITINNNTKQQKLEEYLNKHNDILPVIIIQADGLQVLDSVAQLMAFNDLYKVNNFGTSPYIYCASSASVAGLSLAMDLQKDKNPNENLMKIGNKSSQDVKTAINNHEEANNRKKCKCSCNLFKLIWMQLFGCCVSYNEEVMIDSFYKRIPAATLNSIIEESLQLNSNEKLNIPNLVIKDVNSDSKIIDQVTSANNNQNKKSIKNNVKLFADPLLLLIKKFANKIISNDDANQVIQYGAEKVEDKMKQDGLSKITDKDNIDFIRQKNLHEEDVDRLLLILESNVDNNKTIMSDANGVNIECKELTFDEISEPLHTIKISLHTDNSLINPNYSLESKYNNFKNILSNSKEFNSLIANLPHIDEHESIIEDKENNNINNEHDNDDINNERDNDDINNEHDNASEEPGEELSDV